MHAQEGVAQTVKRDATNSINHPEHPQLSKPTGRRRLLQAMYSAQWPRARQKNSACYSEGCSPSARGPLSPCGVCFTQNHTSQKNDSQDKHSGVHPFCFFSFEGPRVSRVGLTVWGSLVTLFSWLAKGWRIMMGLRCGVIRSCLRTT
jgi:hypothetical protein